MIVDKPSWKIWLFFTLILVLSISACSYNKSENNIPSTPVPINLQDRSWLTGEPCSPPCWYGLYVDHSEEEEVLEVLKTLPFIMADKMATSEAGGGNYLTGEYYTTTKFQAPIIGDKSVVLKIGEGVLVNVWFSLNYDILLDEVVKEIDAPDVVNIYPVRETDFCDFEFFWLEKQLILSTRLAGKNCENTWSEIAHGSPISYSFVIDSVEIIYQDWLTAFLKDNRGYPWPGLKE